VKTELEVQRNPRKSLGERGEVGALKFSNGMFMGHGFIFNALQFGSTKSLKINATGRRTVKSHSFVDLCETNSVLAKFR
jgi:hypothetical protein